MTQRVFSLESHFLVPKHCVAGVCVTRGFAMASLFSASALPGTMQGTKDVQRST